MAQLLIWAVWSWLLWRLLRWAWGRVFGSAFARPAAPLYLAGEPRHLALALAHPAGFARVGKPYAEGDVPAYAPEEQQRMRRSLLHQLGLSGEVSSDDVIRRQVSRLLREQWWRLDLADPRPGEDPLDALAFACARVAVGTRHAAALGWIDADLQWQVLMLNLQRAAECFDGWDSYGRAWARGRRQWLVTSRADTLGLHFSEADVSQWLADQDHPWSQLPWPARTAEVC